MIGEFLVPAGLANRVAHVDEGGDAGVVAQEVGVHVHDELVFQSIGALLSHRGRRGFRGRHVEQRSVDLVHRDKRGGHTSGALEKPAAALALLAAEIVGHRQ